MRKQQQKARINLNRTMMMIDKPIMALSGAVIGFLLTGVIYMIFGGLMDAPEGQIWNWDALLGGLICIGISIGITVFIFIYWNLIVKKKGVVVPMLIGLGWIFAIFGFCSAVLLSAELITKFVSHRF